AQPHRLSRGGRGKVDGHARRQEGAFDAQIGEHDDVRLLRQLQHRAAQKRERAAAGTAAIVIHLCDSINNPMIVLASRMSPRRTISKASAKVQTLTSMFSSSSGRGGTLVSAVAR